MQSEYYAILHS